MSPSQKEKKEYATVTKGDGVNYREIAEIMTDLGYDMNHSSARNHLLRIMRRFYDAYCEAQGFVLSDVDVENACRSANFQEAVSLLIQQIEHRRRMLRPVVAVSPVKTLDAGAVKRRVYGSSASVCVRYRSQTFVPRSATCARPGSEVLLLTVGSDSRNVEVHVPGGSAEEWVLKQG